VLQGAYQGVEEWAKEVIRAAPPLRSFCMQRPQSIAESIRTFPRLLFFEIFART
jgi:hypothetical protein